MKVYTDVAQGSADWFKLRMGIPTASCFDKIITPKEGKPSKSAIGYAYQLLAELLLKAPTETIEGQQWMDRGKELEPDAVRQYEYVEEVETYPVGFVTTDDGRVGASPDRMLKGVPAGLEIKCPAPHTHLAYLLDGLNDAYRPQVQGQIYVCEFEHSDFYSYHPRMPPRLIRTPRDDGYIKQLIVALSVFNEKLFELLERAKSMGVFQAYENVATPQDLERAQQLSGELEQDQGLPPLKTVAPEAVETVGDLVGSLPTIVIMRGKDRADPCASIEEWRDRMTKGIEKLPETSCFVLLDLNAASMAKYEHVYPEDVQIVRQLFERKIGRDR